MKEPPSETSPATPPVVEQDDSPEDVVTTYLPLVEHMARQLHRRLPPGHDLDALVNSGVVGCCSRPWSDSIPSGVYRSTSMPGTASMGR